MRAALLLTTALWIGYTGWCCLYGPPWREAYGLMVHAAYCAAEPQQPMARCE